jgi:hypothetical protein
MSPTATTASTSAESISGCLDPGSPGGADPAGAAAGGAGRTALTLNGPFGVSPRTRAVAGSLVGAGKVTS